MVAGKDQDPHTLARTHGIHAYEARGEMALEPAEIDSLKELREMLRVEPGRLELRIEVTSRLAIIVRKAFTDMYFKLNDPDWWESGVVRRGSTYFAELRRWLDSWPEPCVEDARSAELQRILMVVEEEAADCDITSQIDR